MRISILLFSILPMLTYAACPANGQNGRPYCSGNNVMACNGGTPFVQENCGPNCRCIDQKQEAACDVSCSRQQDIVNSLTSRRQLVHLQERMAKWQRELLLPSHRADYCDREHPLALIIIASLLDSVRLLRTTPGVASDSASNDYKFSTATRTHSMRRHMKVQIDSKLGHKTFLEMSPMQLAELDCG